MRRNTVLTVRCPETRLTVQSILYANFAHETPGNLPRRWALVESLPTPSAVRWLPRWTSAATRRFEDAPGASSHTSTRRHAINPHET